MSALGFITRAVFGLEVTEKNGVVRISGIRAKQFIEDINRTFGTSRITLHMLTKASASYVEFYSFFLIDIEYIVRRLANEKNTRLGRRGYIKMEQALKENTWLSGLEKQHPSIFNKSKLKEIKYDLLKHQSEFIDYYDNVIPKYNLRGMLMAATPGSGKTISSIAVACAFESKNVIVISPKNAVFRVWEKTLAEDMNVEQTTWVHASKKPMPSPRECRWFIFHYESLGDAITLANKLSSERCTIILDESHNLNEMKSLRTERFVSMCKSMKNSLIVELSGTPMKAMGAEAIPLISAIDPLFTEPCIEKFKKIYGKEAKAATEILSNRLGIIMYKVNKEESKIAEPIEHTLKVKVKDSEKYTLDTIKQDMANFIKQRTEHYKENKKSYEIMYNAGLKEFEAVGLKNLTKPEQYETYKKYIKEFAKNGYDPFSSAPKAVYCNDFEKKIIQPVLSQKVRKDFKNAKSVVKYVDLKIRGECLGTVLSRARTNCNKSILDNLDLASLIDGAEKKTLIFTSYVEIVKAAAEKLTEQGYSPLTVYAETNNNLPAMVSQFDKDESINPMIATYQSLSTAVPLIMANRVILLNSPFRIHEKEQTVARANRIGQDKTVDVYNVLLDTGDIPNISTRSSDIMEWSRIQVNQIMGFDNKDNMVSVEAYLQEDECMLNIDDVIEPDDFVEIDNLQQPGDIVMSQTQVSLEQQMNKLFNELNTVTNFNDSSYRMMNIGLPLNHRAVSIFNVINPCDNVVTLENHLTDMQVTAISLEEQNNKSKNILLKLAELFIKFLESVMLYLSNAERLAEANMAKAKEILTYIKNSNTEAFKHVVGKVNVNNPAWLTRGGTVSAMSHLRDYKWQTETTRRTVAILSNEFKQFTKDAGTHLSQVTATPGLNQMTTIVKRLHAFDKLMMDSSKITNPNDIIVRSTANIGGKQFNVRYPTTGDSEHYINNYSVFNIKETTVDNFDVKQEEPVEALNRGQAIELLTMVVDNNKQLTYLNSFINSINKEMQLFTKRVKAVNEDADKLDTQANTILVAQASLLLAGVKGLVSYTRGYVKIVDRSSKASLNYVIASAKGKTDIE